ncbi:MAG: hypothetical protein PSV18_14280 [Methylobacter sp.]|nr:hypothetical protein [Candidatus Methylobacter titanis]
MAIKKRDPKKPADNEYDIAEKIERFASAADGAVISKVSDPSASRDYKAIRVPFNQYDYEQLEIGAKLSGRSKLNFIRYAMLKMAKEVQEEQI